MTLAKAGRINAREYVKQIFTANSNNGTQLLVEEVGKQITSSAYDLQAALAGKGHLQQRNEAAAITAVVVGKEFALPVETLNELEESL